MRSSNPTPLLALILGALIQGCGSSGTGPSETITELPRALTMAEEQIIARSNTFGFDLLKEVDKGRDASAPNTVISPLSATMALGMALEGADGETFEAMRDALRFQGLAREEINASYRGLLDLLLELDPEVEMEIANSTWSREGFPFVQAFFDAVTANFDAEIQELDFNDPTSKDIINAWVNENTNGRITDIIDAINPLDILYLINAVYFKGGWTTKFDAEHTTPRAFFLEGGEEISVPTMSGDPEGRWGQVDGVQLGELPFGGQAFTMVFALPPEGQTVGDLTAELDDETWNQWMGALSEGEQLIHLPRFEVEWGGGLKDALASMGMGPAFVPTADFSRLTPAEDAYISAVKQKTFLKVDEDGAEAAAVTSVTVGVTSAPMALQINRPFLVAIRERLSGTILFLGAIRDPR
jgi:serine protease inhibitor